MRKAKFRMISRVPMRAVRSLDEVLAFMESSDGKKVLILDVDNTLAPQGASREDFGHLVDGAIDRFEANGGCGRVIALTNGPQRGVPRMISRGNKPWTSRRRLGLERGHEAIIVVGDQIVTDGVLAWRLKATFLHLVIDDENEPLRQAIMRRVGTVLAGLFFSQET